MEGDGERRAQRSDPVRRGGSREPDADQFTTDSAAGQGVIRSQRREAHPAVGTVVRFEQAVGSDGGVDAGALDGGGGYGVVDDDQGSVGAGGCRPTGPLEQAG